MPQPSSNKRKKSKQKERKKRITSLVVMGVLVVGIFFSALALSNMNKKAEVKKEPESVPEPASSTAAPAIEAESQPVAEAPQLPPATGEFDEEGLPLLLNFYNPLPEGYINGVNLTSVGNKQTMDPRAAGAFTAMQAAAKADGVTLTPVSGYRDNQRQTTNYNNSIQRYIDSGETEEKAIELTRRYYAYPGTSEHEAGLAIDINQIEDSFDQTPAFSWLQQHCNEYGFIFRYRQNTEAITEIAYEPWHYRYVGANHAKLIEELGITLEEYCQMFTA